MQYLYDAKANPISTNIILSFQPIFFSIYSYK
jgi:hypothetical protein